MGPRTTLLVFGVCGIAGVLVDVDYVILYYFVPEWSRRFLHTPLLITASIVICCLGTYLGGLYIRVVLTR